MKKIIATMAVAALAAWAAPASATVITTHAGGNLSNSNPLGFDVTVDLSGIFGAKLYFKTEGNSGINPCDGGSKADCLTVKVNGVEISGLGPQPLSVPNSAKSWSTPIGVDDMPLVTLTFLATFSNGSESIDVSNIKVTNYTVSEPAPIALFGLGLAGLGFMRRKRST